jgi:hypothetical protein
MNSWWGLPGSADTCGEVLVSELELELKAFMMLTAMRYHLSCPRVPAGNLSSKSFEEGDCVLRGGI